MYFKISSQSFSYNVPQAHSLPSTNTIETLPTHRQISTASGGWEIRTHTSKVSIRSQKAECIAYSPVATQIILVTHCTLVRTYFQWLIYNLWSFNQVKPPTTSHTNPSSPPVSMTVSSKKFSLIDQLHTFPWSTLFINLFLRAPMIFIFTCIVSLYFVSPS